MQAYTNTEVLNLLRENPIMSIAVSADNVPISSILLFAVDDNFAFYFATHSNSYKAKALEKNPAISISVWEHNQFLFQAQGIASLVSENDVDLTLDKLANSTTKAKDFWPPLLNIDGDSYSVYKIKLSWARVLDIRNLTIGSDHSLFTQISL